MILPITWVLGPATLSCPAERVLNVHPPLFEKPLGDVDAVAVALAPAPQLYRNDIFRTCELQPRDLSVKLCRASERGVWRFSPVGIAAFRHDADDTPTYARWAKKRESETSGYVEKNNRACAVPVAACPELGTDFAGTGFFFANAMSRRSIFRCSCGI